MSKVELPDSDGWTTFKSKNLAKGSYTVFVSDIEIEGRSFALGKIHFRRALLSIEKVYALTEMNGSDDPDTVHQALCQSLEENRFSVTTEHHVFSEVSGYTIVNFECANELGAEDVIKFMYSLDNKE